jgi:hypothetical protein
VFGLVGIARNLTYIPARLREKVLPPTDPRSSPNVELTIFAMIRLLLAWKTQLTAQIYKNFWKPQAHNKPKIIFTLPLRAGSC